METRRWGAVWLVGAWLVGAWLAMAAGTPGVASAQDRFGFGTKDLGISGGYSLSHDRENVERVDGFHILPHFGFFFSKYFELLAEPALIHLRSDSESGTVFGVQVLGRLVIDTGTRFFPYLEGGAGILGGQLNFRQTNCDVNYSFSGGPGVLIFVAERTAVTVGYRYQHISNNGSCDQNLGLNSSLFLVGVSHFFP